MKDIAYGTRQYKLDTTQFEYEGSGTALEESVELERGQNLLQLHIAQVSRQTCSHKINIGVGVDAWAK